MIEKLGNMLNLKLCVVSVVLKLVHSAKIIINYNA